MTDWTAIDNAEVVKGKPAFASVARRLRDNMTALAEGDSTVPEANKLTAGSFKQPTTAAYTAVLAHQGDSYSIDGDRVSFNFFQAVVVVAGAYRFSGTRSTTSQNTVKIYVNDVEVKDVSTASFNYDMDLSIGDKIVVDVRSFGFGVTVSDFRLLAEIYVPMAQCHFNKYAVIEEDVS